MKSFFKEWKKTSICLLLILTFGFVIRYINLTYLPIFADEAIYIRWAQVMRSEPALRFLPLSDGKQPLQMWSMIPFLKFFEDPLMAGRLLSVITGLGTIIGVFVATYILFKNKKIALLSSFIYCLVPFSVFFDRLALSDSMLTMFGVWVFAFGLLLSKSLRLDVAMILGFILGAASLTKSPAIYFALMLPLFVVYVERRNVLKFVALLIPTYLIGFGIYNILRLGPEFHMLALRSKDYLYPLNHILTSPFDPLFPFLDRIKEYYWIMGTPALMVMWLYGYIVNWKSYRKELLILTIWFLGPILLSAEFSKTMTARYVLFSLPFFVIIATTVALNGNKIIQNIGRFLFGLFLLQSILFNYKLLSNSEGLKLPRSERSGYLEEWTAGQGIKEISNYINKELLMIDDKHFVVGTEGYFGTLPDGLQIYFDKSDDVKVIGVGLQLDGVPESLINAKKAGDKAYLVLNDERANVDFKSLGLELINSYPKAIRPDGTYQSLLLYEVTPTSVKIFDNEE